MHGRASATSRLGTAPNPCLAGTFFTECGKRHNADFEKISMSSDPVLVTWHRPVIAMPFSATNDSATSASLTLTARCVLPRWRHGPGQGKSAGRDPLWSADARLSGRKVRRHAPRRRRAEASNRPLKEVLRQMPSVQLNSAWTCAPVRLRTKFFPEWPLARPDTWQSSQEQLRTTSPA